MGTLLVLIAICGTLFLIARHASHDVPDSVLGLSDSRYSSTFTGSDSVSDEAGGVLVTLLI